MSRSSRVDHVKAVEELHEALTARLSEMTTSEDWLKYLSNARRFHRYSPQNQMLLAVQGAEGAVAGYRNWQRIPAQGGGTCQVAKGQVGLKILAPMKGRSVQTDEVTGEEVTKHFLRGFRTVSVFHQGQLVAPPDIGQEAVMPTLLTGENRWEDVWSAVSDQLEANGYDVDLHSRSPIEKWNGQTNYATRQVLIADDLEPAQQLKTLLHEWAHVNLDHESRSLLPRDVREVEAESVAYLLGQTIGLDSQAYSVPYIAGWAVGDLDLIETTAQQVLATTKQLVETLEHDLGIKLTVDVLDHALPEADTNVIALPGSTPPNRPTPQDIAPATRSIEQAALFPTDGGIASPLDRDDSTDAEFLKALGSELEPDQAAQLVTVIYRPEHAATSARILAESGRTATQTARILERFGIDHDRIADCPRHAGRQRRPWRDRSAVRHEQCRRRHGDHHRRRRSRRRPGRHPARREDPRHANAAARAAHVPRPDPGQRARPHVRAHACRRRTCLRSEQCRPEPRRRSCGRHARR